MMKNWNVGDRVLIQPTRRNTWTLGTVVDMDLDGLPRGVQVRLDRPVNGIDHCYATHDELKNVCSADGRERCPKGTPECDWPDCGEPGRKGGSEQ